MARNPIVFENGSLSQKATVEIDGTIYEVEPAQYEGNTPLSAYNLNKLQENLYDYVDEENTNQTQQINQNLSNLTYIKDNYAILTGSVNIQTHPTGRYSGTTSFNYPSGFTKNNCVVISHMFCTLPGTNNESYNTSMGIASNNYVTSTFNVSLNNNNISVTCFDSSASGTHPIKIILLKYIN